MMVKSQVEVFLVVMFCGFVVGYQSFGGSCYPEDGCSMALRNVGILPQYYTPFTNQKILT